MAPTVSVIIPTYNRSGLVANAIDSVLAQTYTDYELIVVDDGSTDDSRERLKPYMERIRYFYQDNRGASAAQNKGIEVAVGKWISILASDDTWLPTKLERQINALSTMGDEFAVCFTDCIFVGDPGLKLSAFERAGLKADSEFGQLDKPFRYILGDHLPICPQSLMVLRSLLKEGDKFDEALGVSEDTDIIFRLALKTKFCFVSEPLVRIDQTPTRPRLSDFLVHKNDQLFIWFEYRYRKWLAIPEVLDSEIRAPIEGKLRTLYYEWASARLRQLRIAEALQTINAIRHLGDSHSTILTNLLSRATKKMLRILSGHEHFRKKNVRLIT